MPEGLDSQLTVLELTYRTYFGQGGVILAEIKLYTVDEARFGWVVGGNRAVLLGVAPILEMRALK